MPVSDYGHVDFHAHVLPGADHGSSSVETTLFQLNAALQYGVKRIIATPHFYPGSHNVETFIERRNRAFEMLKPHLTEDMPEIRVGAEVLVCNGIENLPGLDNLFIHGTNTLLLELPFSDFQNEYCDSVYNLVSSGVNVVLAHADRYDSGHIEKMIENGAKIQLNASSLACFFKRTKLYEWMARDLVVAIGSDIHGHDKRAYKDFVRAFSRAGAYGNYIDEKSKEIFEKADALDM